MKKRLVWALIAVTLLAVVFSFWIWHLSTSGTTTARVARLLAENIPPGTHIDDVTAWIHSQPFPGSPALPFVKVGDRDRKPRPVSGAMLGNANVDLIFPGRIILKFHYDKDDRLVSYEMETQVLMP